MLIPEELMNKMHRDGLLMLDTHNRSKTTTNKKIVNNDISLGSVGRKSDAASPIEVLSSMSAVSDHHNLKSQDVSTIAGASP